MNRGILFTFSQYSSALQSAHLCYEAAFRKLPCGPDINLQSSYLAKEFYFSEISEK